MTKPLDPELFQRVTTVIDRARRSGANVPTRLNDAHLIWTPEREHRVRIQAATDMLLQFDQWMPHEFLRLVNRELVNCTPTDMYVAIRKWMDQWFEHVRANK